MPGPFGPPWVLTTVSPVDPPVGSTYSLVVPAGDWYHVLQADWTLITSAAAANRFSHMRWLDTTGNGAGLSIAATAQAASLTYQYRSGLNFVPSTLINNNNLLFTTPDVAAPEAWKFVLGALNLQAGDQLSGITITFEVLAYV